MPFTAVFRSVGTPGVSLLEPGGDQGGDQGGEGIGVGSQELSSSSLGSTSFWRSEAEQQAPGVDSSSSTSQGFPVDHVPPVDVPGMSQWMSHLQMVQAT